MQEFREMVTGLNKFIAVWFDDGKYWQLFTLLFAISPKKFACSVCDGGVTVRTLGEGAEADCTLWHLGALKSISLSCKYGILCVGVGISHLFSFDVHGVSSRTRRAVSTQCRIAPTWEQVSASPAMQVQWARTGDVWSKWSTIWLFHYN